MDELLQLLQLKGVTDVMVNGPNDVCVDRGFGIERIEFSAVDSVKFVDTAAEVREIAQQLAGLADVRLDDAMPIADGLIPSVALGLDSFTSGFADGSGGDSDDSAHLSKVATRDIVSETSFGIRFHAVLAPVAPQSSGALISLRVPTRVSLSLGDLIDRETLTEEEAKLLREAVKAKANIMISGSTGSGKTTLMSALIAEIPENERIIVVEEAREVNEKLHSGMQFLTSKKANIEGAGEVTLASLVKATMRMRPDRVIIGEVRGDEIVEYISLLNTGHRGSISTIHANSASDIVDRASLLASSAGMDYSVAKQQLKREVDLVVHIARVDGKRQVTQIVRKSVARKPTRV